MNQRYEAIAIIPDADLAALNACGLNIEIISAEDLSPPDGHIWFDIMVMFYVCRSAGDRHGWSVSYGRDWGGQYDMRFVDKPADLPNTDRRIGHGKSLPDLLTKLAERLGEKV